jgi:hypothetical protein
MSAQASVAEMPLSAKLQNEEQVAGIKALLYA